MAYIVDYWYIGSESLDIEMLLISQWANWHTDVESAESQSERRTNPSLEYEKLHR